MSADDLAKGIEALEDDEVRAAVGGGDLSAFAGLELTDEEVALLEGAADEYPEVVGLDIRAGLLGLNAGVKLNPTAAGATPITQDVTANKAKTAEKAFQQMDGYIRG